jgi:hypothetical protein
VYPSTEADLLERYPSEDGCISTEDGLRLVLEACYKLETQVFGLPGREGQPADAL